MVLAHLDLEFALSDGVNIATWKILYEKPIMKAYRVYVIEEIAYSSHQMSSINLMMQKYLIY